MGFDQLPPDSSIPGPPPRDLGSVPKSNFVVPPRKKQGIIIKDPTTHKVVNFNKPPTAPALHRDSLTKGSALRDSRILENGLEHLNEYFIPGDGILREVIEADICRYLGLDALVRPGRYQDRQGYFIRAYRNLTSVSHVEIGAIPREFH